ncbi:MAG: D-glycerate dehydrogenase [Actinomycetota bacterium]|nr:D-glycerate dehydrogenase [Actinomycetota bacterium]
MARVYVCRRLPSEVVEPLAGLHEVRTWAGKYPVPRDVFLEEAASAEGLLTMITETIDLELLDAAPRLRIVSQMAVGVDNIDVGACHERGIEIGHTPGVLTETVADTAFALLASVVRRLPEGERAVKDGSWGPWDPFWMTGSDLFGTTIGIVGMGRIGRAIARRASGFGMEILYSASSEKEDAPGRFLPLDEVLARSDHVMICVSLSDETVGLIGAREFGLMRKDAFLVNISRGPVVDTNALVDALGAGSIAGAGLDVTDPEPLPPNHPLLGFSNCLVIPHIGSASTRTRMAMGALAVENLLAGLDDRPMPAPVAWPGG